MKRLPWWQLPVVIAGVVAGLTALGTGILTASRFLTLPEKVEAGEQKNAQQDKQIDRLITLQEFYAKEKQAPPPRGLREWDDDREVYWCCPLDDRQACFDRNQWTVCE